MKGSATRMLVWTLLCAALWAGGVAVRRAVYHQQTRTLQGVEAPFLMESALQFRMTRMVAETGTLPEVDDKVQVPEGVEMRKTYSVGSEWIYAGLASLLPEDWTLVSRVRWVSIGLFCLAIPFAALWAGIKHQSVLSGLAVGGLLAVSPAFAVRSSGLELSRENLAIPLFTLFLLAETAFKNTRGTRGKWVWSLVAAASLAAAQCVWDLTQYVTGLWVVWGLFRRILEKEEPEGEKLAVTAVAAAQVLVSVWNPYLRAHAFFFSPVMALLLARSLMVWCPRLRNRGMLLGIPVLFWVLWWGLGVLFVENYSHFGELLSAKIRFLNRKPEDPSLLTFAQRIMWTPALNSSTWLLTKLYFPIVFYLFGIALLLLIRGLKHGTTRFQSEFFYAGFTLAVYVFFFRFHVFLILFLALCIGSLFASCRTCRGFWGRWALPVMGLLIFLGTEFYLLLFFEPKPAGPQLAQQQQLMQLVRAMGGDEQALKGNRWGRPGAAYGEVEKLAAALSGLSEPGPVLANFGISASILAETELPIVLHPKFETPGIRERVREFYEHLFLKSEKELRDWATSEDIGALYYVHSNGNFSDLDPANSPRYMVDALEPPEGAAVYTLENHPEEAFWFRPLPYQTSRRYRIYRIVTPEDEELAHRYTRLAAMAYESGDMETARKRAMQALNFHWKYPPAHNLLRAIPR